MGLVSLYRGPQRVVCFLSWLVWEAHHDFALSLPREGDIAQMSRSPRRTRPYVLEDVSWTLWSKEVLLPLTQWDQSDLSRTRRDSAE